MEMSGLDIALDDLDTVIRRVTENCISSLNEVDESLNNMQENMSNNVTVVGNGRIFNIFSHAFFSGSKNKLKTKLDSNAKSFSKVSLSGPFNVIYNKDNACSVNIKAPEDILEHITIYVKDDTLYIEPLNSFTTNRNIVINITAPYIKDICINGSGMFEAKSEINLLSNNCNMALLIRGSGDIILKRVYAKNLTAEIKGSGDISMKFVEVKRNTDLSIAGSGDISINTLYTHSVSGNVAGSGDITVVTIFAENIQQQISGSGNINF